ncbi:MAG: hypothetical protein MMC33_008442 [Icmadophila ericetorum]|nr:hypothetical protein [Icmadophila ericetorum]
MRRLTIGHSLLLLSALYGRVLSSSTLTFWGDYPPCAENCHEQLFASSGCPLEDSCLCENPTWLQNNAACIAINCPDGQLIESANICDNACIGAGFPMAITLDEFISYGELAAESASASASASTTSPVASTEGLAVVVSTTTNPPISTSNPSSTTLTTAIQTPSSTPLASTSPVSANPSSPSPAGSGLPQNTIVAIYVCSIVTPVLTAIIIAWFKPGSIGRFFTRGRWPPKDKTDAQLRAEWMDDLRGLLMGSGSMERQVSRREREARVRREIELGDWR